MISIEEARSRLDLAGQSHILQFWDELSAEERNRFLADLSHLDPEELRDHCRGAAEAASRCSSPQDRLDELMEPVPMEFIGGVCRSDKKTLDDWENEGTNIYFLSD